METKPGSQISHHRWLAARHDELAAPDSWLGLVGLFWLEAGVNRVGSAEGSLVRLPGGPERLGELLWDDGRVVWHPVVGAARELQTDAAGQPSMVEHENWSFFIVDRDGHLAARLRDRDWAAGKPFTGLDYFDFDPAWQIAADWRALSPPLRMEVHNVSGELKTVEVAHQAVFEVAGQTVTLLPMSVNDEEIFFVFRDRTSGKETYGAGRFLKVPAATMETTAGPGVDGKISLDFNRAYNPPCAFTPFATCPLPPPENWLSFAVPAGEKKWVKTA
ncbi:MAG TPA: DUF1684 domain-containing protein [Azonexus sp.]|nr:DUF1684 domain-containing protein [Azonexus sp.]